MKTLELAAAGAISKAGFTASSGDLYAAIEKDKGSKTLMEIEKKASAGMMELGLMLLASAFVNHPLQDAKREYPCPQCGKPMRVQEAAQKRAVETIYGKIEYVRPYCVCDRCGISMAPMDQAMGIPPQGPSVLTREKACLATVTTASFKTASSNLKGLAQIEMAPKRVRGIAEGEGKILAEQRDQEVEKYRAGQWEAPAAARADLMVVCADGGRVQSRIGFNSPEESKANEDSGRKEETEEAKKPESRWKEDKIGVVYDAKPQLNQSSQKRGEYEGAKAQTKTYVGTMRPWADFGWMLRVEAEKRGYPNAKQKVFLGDGASHVREVQQLHFSDALFILDWAHAVGHVSEFAKAAFVEEPDKILKWRKVHEDKLWDGKVDEIIAQMQKISRARGEPRDGDSEMSPRVILHRNAFSYFPNNAKAIDYPRFRTMGLPIGSGVVEGGVKQFAKRLKGTEKFWNVMDVEEEIESPNTGAEEMLALCSLYFSEDGRWDRHWDLRGRARYQPSP